MTDHSIGAPPRPRVAVAMSGGVDSSVAAALLKSEGFDVIGMMLRLWSESGKEDSNRCCTPESVGLARRAAAILDIPFYVVDARAPFRERVVESFLAGYATGGTPNPCLDCNRTIRWGLLLEHALAMGAERMATGHYARIGEASDGTVQLLRGRDPLKDQSYVLHVLSQEQLKRAVFPVGGYTKADVRALAQKHSLPSATRHDSQDLCFLAGGDYREFLRRQKPEILVDGEIVDARGRSLGLHHGLANYTIGQRKGLGIPSSTPLYVLGKESASNRLIVGTRGELGTTSLTATEVRWTSRSAPTSTFEATVKTRYTALEQPATIVPLDGGRKVQVSFASPQRDITPGQAAVFYDGDVVLGGGLIQ
jgi:tRNA-specific 2-thiouridylase